MKVNFGYSCKEYYDLLLKCIEKVSKLAISTIFSNKLKFTGLNCIFRGSGCEHEEEKNTGFAKGNGISLNYPFKKGILPLIT